MNHVRIANGRRRNCQRTLQIVVARYAAVFFAAATPFGADAAIYNLRLTTDNAPDYTDMESLVQSTVAGCTTPEEQCIAIWSMARQSRRQTTAQRESGRVLYDPILHYNSYGTLNCGIVSSLNNSCWHLLGYKSRYIQLGDHTVSEVSWDDGKTWHMFDSSMSYYCYNHEGEIASCAEIQEAHACELSGGKSEPGHYYMYHGADNCASHLGGDAWRKAGDEPVKYERTLKNGADSYTDGFDVQGDTYIRFGQKYTLGLLPHQIYTRYWQPLETVAALAGTFEAEECFRPVDRADPNNQHHLGNIRGNGLWIFEPDFADPSTIELFYEDHGVELALDDGGPKLRPMNSGQDASVIFKISAANVITSIRIDGEAFRKSAGDRLRILVSPTAGISWQPVWESSETGPQVIRLRLRDEVAAVTECFVKVELKAQDNCQDVGINSLRLTTITQVNRRTLPGLTLGSNRIRLSADDQVETLTLWPWTSADDPRPSTFEEENVHRTDVRQEAFYKANLGPARNGEPGHVIWRLAAPSDLTGVEFGVISTNKSRDSYVATAVSFDGQEFDELDRNTQTDQPFDPLSFYRVEGERIPAGAREVYLKCSFETPSGAGTYTMPGIQDILMRAFHRPRNGSGQPLEVVYEWIEHRDTGDVHRSHSEIIESLPHEYAINTAGFRDPTMKSVRLRLLDPRETAKNGNSGYSDGQDVGDAYEPTALRYEWGDNLAADKPYVASRQSTQDNANPDTNGVELTNQKVIPPTEFTNSDAVQPATAFWSAGEPVEFVLDLSEAADLAGVRVTAHQPNANYLHPLMIHVDVSADGANWTHAGTIHQKDVWNPPSNFERWEHDDDPDFSALPAGGRLSYPFPLVFKKAIPGRFVRFKCTPHEGHGMGLSELEVFDKATIVSGR